MSGALRMLGAIALQGALEGALLPQVKRERGLSVQTQWAPTVLLMDRIERGERADILILTDEALAALADRGLVDPSRIVPLARAILGVGVVSGTPHPDISTSEAFRQSLLAARSVCFSQSGTSGIYFAGLIERLGIADRIRSRATIAPSGFTGARVVTGEADLAIQQISELRAVEGIEVVGPFPDELQNPTNFSAAIMTDTQEREEAIALLDRLTDRTAIEAYRHAGLEPRSSASS